MWRVSLLSLLVATALHAEILPSFVLDLAAAKATHIVVVTEGREIDGKVFVLESWRGDLRNRDMLTLPELAAFKSKESRRVTNGLWVNKKEAPVFVTGDRMVLFLVRNGDKWEGAGHDLRTSVVWIDADKAYALQQWFDPGPLEVGAIEMSERELKEKIEQIELVTPR